MPNRADSDGMSVGGALALPTLVSSLKDDLMVVPSSSRMVQSMAMSSAEGGLVDSAVKVGEKRRGTF